MTNLEKITEENKLMGTAAHLGGLINKMKRLKENRPTYPTELLPILVKADFDRERIVMTDQDLGDSYCRLCVEDREHDWETNDDHAWIDVPVLWFEEATADYMKEVGIWDEYRPEDEYLISDWLQCNLHDWDLQVIVDTVFQRVLDDIFKNIETLPV